VALDHIPERTDAVVEARALADALRLGVGDLYMIDVVAVPQRLEQQIGEAEHQHVLHRALAEVVIDAVDLLLAEVALQMLVQNLGALQVVAERLLHHQPRPAVGRAVQPAGGKPVHGLTIERRRNGQVEQQVGGELVVAEPLRQALESRILLDIALDEVEPPQQPLQHLAVQSLAQLVAQDLAHPAAPLLVGPVATTKADDAHRRGQMLAPLQVVERG